MSYIIEIKIKIEGIFLIKYHEKISENENKKAENVYCEHITTDKKKAKHFHNHVEALRVNKLFYNSVRTGKIIKVIS